VTKGGKAVAAELVRRCAPRPPTAVPLCHAARGI